MDIFCLKNGIGQSDKQRNAHLEKLRESIVPRSEAEGVGTADRTAEQGQQLRQSLDLLASGAVESICFNSLNLLARSEEEFALLKSFLSEHEIGLNVAEAGNEPKPPGTGHGSEGADANTVDDVEAL